MKDDKIDQSLLIPFKLTDIIPEDHICYFIRRIVDEMDFRSINKRYQGTPGNKAYPRKMLLRVVIMASIDNIHSSRELSKRIQTDVVYMYLAGMEQPDFKTFSNFKKEFYNLIVKFFKITVDIATQEDINLFKDIGIEDHNNVKVNKSLKKMTDEEKLQVIRVLLKRGIHIDNKEDKILGDELGNTIPKKLQSKKAVHEAYEKVVQNLY